MITIAWAPFLLMYHLDLSVWYAVWSAVVGAILGVVGNVGVVRDYNSIRQVLCCLRVNFLYVFVCICLLQLLTYYFNSAVYVVAVHDITVCVSYCVQVDVCAFLHPLHEICRSRTHASLMFFLCIILMLW